MVSRTALYLPNKCNKCTHNRSAILNVNFDSLPAVGFPLIPDATRIIFLSLFVRRAGDSGKARWR